MTLKLSQRQCRVIGVMLEKEITTPEQYPLSLNGLTNACNQKSSREPVMTLTESEVQNILDELAQMKLISDQGAFSSRVQKYHHRFCNTEFGSLQLSKQQLAIICVLMLRGAQSPGELRTRTNRLAEFTNVTEVEQVLSQLNQLNDEPLVMKLEREPGKRDARFVHLLSEVPDTAGRESQMPGESDVMNTTDSLTRIAELEQQVQELKVQVVELQQFMQQFSE